MLTTLRSAAVRVRLPVRGPANADVFPPEDNGQPADADVTLAEREPADPMYRESAQYPQRLVSLGGGELYQSSSCAKASPGWLLGTTTDCPYGEMHGDNEAEKNK